MDKERTRTLIEALQEVCRKKSAAGRFSIPDAAREFTAGLEKDTILQLAADRIAGAMERLLPKAVKSDPTHPAQTSFGFAHMEPITITKDKTAIQSREMILLEYRADTARLEKKLVGYKYARRKKPDIEALEKQIQERKRFDPRFAKLTAGEPELPVWKAKELDAERRKTARAQRNRKGGKARQGLNPKSTT